MSLADNIRRSTTLYSNDDANWVNYVKDHYKEIVENHSTVEYLDPIRHNTYRYQIEEYLQEMGMPKDLWWLVFYINQLDSNKDFHDLIKIRLPDCKYLDVLRLQYDTVMSQRKILRSQN